MRKLLLLGLLVAACTKPVDDVEILNVEPMEYEQTYSIQGSTSGKSDVLLEGGWQFSVDARSANSAWLRPGDVLTNIRTDINVWEIEAGDFAMAVHPNNPDKRLLLEVREHSNPNINYLELVVLEVVNGPITVRGWGTLTVQQTEVVEEPFFTPEQQAVWDFVTEEPFNKKYHNNRILYDTGYNQGSFVVVDANGVRKYFLYQRDNKMEKFIEAFNFWFEVDLEVVFDLPSSATIARWPAKGERFATFSLDDLPEGVKTGDHFRATHPNDPKKYFILRVEILSGSNEVWLFVDDVSRNGISAHGWGGVKLIEEDYSGPTAFSVTQHDNGDITVHNNYGIDGNSYIVWIPEATNEVAANYYWTGGHYTTDRPDYDGSDFTISAAQLQEWTGGYPDNSTLIVQVFRGDYSLWENAIRQTIQLN